MATLEVTANPQSYGDGAFPLYVTSSDDFLYGFGDTLPIDWHRFEPKSNAYILANPNFGKFWYKANDELPCKLTITVGNRSESYEDAVARGEVSGAYPFNSYGRYSATGGEVNHIIWPDGVFNIPPSSGVQMSIVSTSANDDGNPVGTGIRTMDIHYLDNTLTPQIETVTLNGTTPVLTVATNIRFIQCLHILTAGSLKSAAGTITVSNGGITYSQIDIGSRRCASSARMVPAGKVLFIKGSVGSSVSLTADTTAEIKLSSTYFEGHDLTSQLIFMPFGGIGMQNNAIPYSFPVPFGPFPAGTIVAMEVSVNKAAIITGDWFGYLENA